MDGELILQKILGFLVMPDAEWSFCTFPFLLSFIVFYAIYIALTSTLRQKNSRGAKANRQSKVVLWYVIAYSLLFAWKANGVLVVMLLLTTLFSWLATRLMSSSRHRRLWLVFIIIVDLAPLVYFKYTNFIISIVNDIARSNFAPLDLFLPVGISFYTFQAISYSVDIYRKKFTARTPLLNYTFYLTFFPLLMAGPITRASVLLPQVGGRLKSKSGLAYKGLWLIMVGLVKKAVVADYIAGYNNWVFDDPLAYSGFENLMGVLGFTLQIFFDFSGYSDMAIGLAALLGYELKDNFRFPYQSLNPQEFWHRWHIALSTWFRDYLYIPMGGNRRGQVRTYFNNFVTMVVAGLWHGASWMFVIWGAVHGVALVVHKLCRRLFLDRIPNNPAVRAVSWTLMFVFINVTWIFFRADSIDMAMTILNRIATDFSLDYFLPFVKARPVWLAFVLVGLELHSIREDDYHWLEQKFVESPWFVKLILFTAVVQLVINFSQDSVQPFIYMQF